MKKSKNIKYMLRILLTGYFEYRIIWVKTNV